MNQPCVCQLKRISRCEPRVAQHLQNFLTYLVKGFSMQFDSANASAQVHSVLPGRKRFVTGLQQALNSRQQKITRTKGGLKQCALMELVRR